MGNYTESLWGALVFTALAGQVILLMRLTITGLFRAYPMLTLWAVSSAIKGGVLFAISRTYALNSRAYVSAWNWTSLLATICLVLAAIETFRCMVGNYPTAKNYGRKVFCYSALLALGAALLPFSLDDIARDFMKFNWRVIVFMRTASIAVALGLVISTAHLHRVKIPERRNLRINRALMVVCCIVQAIGSTMILLSRNSPWKSHWNTMYLCFTALIWVLWPLLVSARGEILDKVESTDELKSDIEKRWAGFKRAMGRQPGREIPARALRQSEQES